MLYWRQLDPKCHLQLVMTENILTLCSGHILRKLYNCGERKKDFDLQNLEISCKKF